MSRDESHAGGARVELGAVRGCLAFGCYQEGASRFKGLG